MNSRDEQSVNLKNTRYLFDKLDESFNISETDVLINKEGYDNLVKRLDEYFENGTNKNSIIGLTGQWGSGKTSFCKYLEFNLSKKNYIFCFYDLWQHQEDYLKKSVLFELTSSLMEKKVLGSGAHIESAGVLDWMHDNHVGSKINYSDSSASKKITLALIIGFLFLCLKELPDSSNFFKSGINFIKTNFEQNLLSCNFIFSVLLSLFLFCSCIFLFRRRIKKFFTKIISFITKNKISTISEESCNSDLSVRDFQLWINSIYANIKKDNARVVFILDNIDRLPVDKIKELFSLVHDVFYCLNKNISASTKKIHVLIPFDYVTIFRSFNSMQEDYTLHKIIKFDTKSKTHDVENDVNSETGFLSENDGISESEHDKENNLNNQETQLSGKLLARFKYTEDILDKTFSTIFYIPHISPYNYKDFFEKKLTLIINSWLSNLFSEFSSQEYAEKLKQEICTLKNTNDGLLKKIIENCWQMFTYNRDFNDLSIRKVLSFLRQLHVLLSINTKNFFYDNFVSVRNIILYAAFYSSIAPLFRRYSFAQTMNIIKDDWQNIKFGLSPISTFKNNGSEKRAIDAIQKEIFYTYMQIMFYQASKENLFSGELFYQTLATAFKYSNLYLIELKLNGNFFKENSNIVITELLQRVDISVIILYFGRVLSDDIKVVDGQNKYIFSENVWGNLFTLLIQQVIFNAISGRLENNSVFLFFKKIFESKLSSTNASLKIFYIFLLVSYLKILISKLIDSKAGKEAVSNIISYIHTLLTLDSSVKAKFSICDSFLLTNVKNQGIDMDLFYGLRDLHRTVSITDEVSISNNNSYSNTKSNKCIISSGVYDINFIIIQIMTVEKLLTAFRHVSKTVCFRYLYDKDSCVHVCVNWVMPVSAKVREFLISNVSYSYDDEINLCDEFIKVFSGNNQIKKFEATLDNKYKLYRYIYKYALLCKLYDRKETMSLDDICNLLNIRKDSLLILSRSTQRYNQLSPFVQFIVGFVSLLSISISEKDNFCTKNTELEQSELYKYDNIDESLPEFFSLNCALKIIYSYIFMDIDMGKNFISKLQSNIREIKFFLEALLNNDSSFVNEMISFFQNKKNDVPPDSTTDLFAETDTKY